MQIPRVISYLQKKNASISSISAIKFRNSQHYSILAENIANAKNCVTLLYCNS